MYTPILEVDFKYPVRLNQCSPTATSHVSVFREELNGELGYIGSNTGEVVGFLTENAVLAELRSLGAQIHHICRLV